MAHTFLVADLFIVLKFLRIWSQHFTNPLDPVTEPRPVYLDAVATTLPAPSDQSRLEYIRSKLPPLLFHTFPLDDIPASIFAPFPIRRIDLRFSSAQVSTLQRALLRYQSEVKIGDSTNVAKLTGQDALSAFVVAALNASYDTPANQISNVVNVSPQPCFSLRYPVLTRRALVSRYQPGCPPARHCR